MSLVALRHRNFRLLWLGLFASYAGTLMQTAVILWHVSLLVAPAHRALALGGVGLVRVVPIVVFSMISGVAADVLDRRRVMLVTQSGMAVLAAVLAAVSWHGLHALWVVYLLAAVTSAIGAFDLPARQALLPNLVPREHLPNALSLNTIVFQIAAVVGPAAGGLVIAALGVAWAYAITALSFAVVIVGLLMMRDVRAKPEPHPSTAGQRGFSVHAAMEGLRFVFRAPLIRSTMLLDFFATFFSSATALLPIYAQSILRVGASGYGWLYAAPAVGAILASAVMVRAVDVIERRGTVLS
ncbi:MAG TPA: MFS transporter, partial [Vicinamibacterales bacterium]|nr:MFS transporter [Vicinamibacterales bacterium]